MKLRRTFAVLFSAAGCAVALMFPAPRPGTIELTQHFQQLASADNFADGDATMAALRQQADAALASLQAAAANRP
jgi:hypothetical protein